MKTSFLSPPFKSFSILAVVLALGLVLSPETARGQAEKAQPRRETSRRSPRGGAAALFGRVDADGDGTVSQQEFLRNQKRLFARADSDGDGKLSREEFARIAGQNRPQPARDGQADRSARPAGPRLRADGVTPKSPSPQERMRRSARPGRSQPGAEGGRMFIGRFDKNGDGKVQRSEAPERMRRNFSRADSNGDGALDESELKRLLRRPRPNRKPNSKK